MTAAFKKSNLKKAQKILVKEEKLCYDIRVVGMNMSEAGLSEWQTRWTQNPLMATSCGFKSRGRHSLAGASRQIFSWVEDLAIFLCGFMRAAVWGVDRPMAADRSF